MFWGLLLLLYLLLQQIVRSCSIAWNGGGIKAEVYGFRMVQGIMWDN